MNEWQEFQNWLFDGDVNSYIPEHLCYKNSKISHLYAIRIFRNNKNLNEYLNKHLNYYDLFYIDKKELFYFLKKCVVDFGVNPKTLPWFGYKKQNKDKLYKKLEEKFKLYTKEEIDVIYNYVINSKNKDRYLVSLGLEKEYKKEKKTKNKREPLSNVIRENFTWVKL